MSNQDNQDNVVMNVSEESTDSNPEVQSQSEQKVDTNTPVTIPLYQLINFRQLIDVGTSRGAYRSSELSSVGKVYDELTALINATVQSAAV